MAPRSYFTEFVADLFEEVSASGKRLFFVQGMWRSGTTWLGRMLGDHPQIFVCQHELQSYQKGFLVTLGNRAIESHPFLHERYNVTRKAGFLSLLRHLHKTTKPDATLIADRSPGSDVLRMYEDFPDAKMIIVLRDGRDICISAAHLAKREEPTKNLEFFEPREDGSQQLTDWYVKSAARAYADYVNDYSTLRDRSTDVLFVRYEDLYRDGVSTMCDVFGFLRVRASRKLVEDICRRHTFEAESQRRPGDEDVNADMRKGVIGDWRRYFSDADLATYETIAREALLVGGYKLESSLEQMPNPDAAEYHARAQRKRESGDVEGALRDLTRAVELEPSHALRRISESISTSGDGILRLLPGASNEERRDMFSTPALGYYLRGVARRELGDRDGAVSDFTAALDREPSSSIRRAGEEALDSLMTTGPESQ